MGDEPRRDRTRREALAASAAVVAAGLAGAGVARAAPAAQAMLFTAGGISGGGLLKMVDGEAHVSLFATRLASEGREPIIIGRVQWVDHGWAGRGVTLESAEITAYGPMPSLPNARMMRGEMRVNGAGSYPFELQAVDNGPPGSGQDTLSLAVGTDTSDFSYTAVGTLASGDVQLLSFNFSVGG